MNTITKPILGNKMTPENRLECLLAIKEAIVHICEVMKCDLQLYLAEEAGKLTDSELLDISRGAVQPMRAARSILVAKGPERVHDQFACESNLVDVKRIKRWLKNRP